MTAAFGGTIPEEEAAGDDQQEREQQQQQRQQRDAGDEDEGLPLRRPQDHLPLAETQDGSPPRRSLLDRLLTGRPTTTAAQQQRRAAGPADEGTAARSASAPGPHAAADGTARAVDPRAAAAAALGTRGRSAPAAPAEGERRRTVARLAPDRDDVRELDGPGCVADAAAAAADDGVDDDDEGRDPELATALERALARAVAGPSAAGPGGQELLARVTRGDWFSPGNPTSVSVRQLMRCVLSASALAIAVNIASHRMCTSGPSLDSQPRGTP